MANTATGTTGKTRKATATASAILETITEENREAIKAQHRATAQALEGNFGKARKEYTTGMITLCHAMHILQGFSLKETAETVSLPESNVSRYAVAGMCASVGIDAFDSAQWLAQAKGSGYRLTIGAVKSAFRENESVAKRKSAILNARTLEARSAVLGEPGVRSESGEGKGKRKAHHNEKAETGATIGERTNADIETLGAIVKRALSGSTTREDIETALMTALEQLSGE